MFSKMPDIATRLPSTWIGDIEPQDKYLMDNYNQFVYAAADVGDQFFDCGLRTVENGREE